MMRKLLLFACLCGFAIFAGCSSKKHFKPEVISGKMDFKDKLSSPIRSVSRQGAILKDNTLITFENGISPLVLEKGYRFLAQDKDKNAYAIQKQCDEILIMQDGSENLKKVPFSSCVLSASLRGDRLAMVLIDNTLVYYDLSKKEEIFSQKYANVSAINSYLASPLMNEQYVIYPDLEGKILIYSIAQNKIIKDILVSSDKFFNNVIYLYAKGEYLLGATAKRVSAIINDKSFKYDVDLRDVKFYNDKVYVLGIDGEILELDHTLKLLRKVRLPFAVLSGIVIQNDTLYTLEKGGYVVVLNLKDFVPLVYKNNLAKKKSLFYTQDSIFYDKVYKRFE